uniref:Uncharacterized protein n=1 Tax=Cacopsylla melanoneura TaxID=428564 RepID=A0A8D9BVV4_9HEMI
MTGGEDQCTVTRALFRTSTLCSKSRMKQGVTRSSPAEEEVLQGAGQSTPPARLPRPPPRPRVKRVPCSCRRGGDVVCPRRTIRSCPASVVRLTSETEEDSLCRAVHLGARTSRRR